MLSLSCLAVCYVQTLDLVDKETDSIFCIPWFRKVQWKPAGVRTFCCSPAKAFRVSLHPVSRCVASIWTLISISWVALRGFSWVAKSWTRLKWQGHVILWYDIVTCILQWKKKSNLYIHVYLVHVLSLCFGTEDSKYMFDENVETKKWRRFSAVLQSYREGCRCKRVRTPSFKGTE